MASSETTPVAKQKAKAEDVWQKRNNWNPMIRDALDYAIPHRQNRVDSGNYTDDRVFDMTSPMGAMYFAGNLQKDLFPPASSKFTFVPGPLMVARLPAAELIGLEKIQSNIGKQVDPYFQTGDFDTASVEACFDLGIGTGAIMPVRGDKHQPVFYINIPFENLACASDAWGRQHFFSWKQTLTMEAVREGFKDYGKFSAEFKEKEKAKPNDAVTLYQDFFKTPQGWTWVAYVDDDAICHEFIIQVHTRTQPLAVGRYYRAPGEAYGRTPILLALPSIKTLNKAQELALRSAAVQLLGIWGFRQGGTFNPDMVRVGPGEFWPMQSTGGVMGPDVTRIDAATGRLDIARMVIEGLRDDIKGVLLDNRIKDDGSTPPSASQVVAMLQDRANSNIGAYGRLSREFMPILAPRTAEILSDGGYINIGMHFNELLMTTKVKSPMQTALDARQLESTISYFDLAVALAGPENVNEHVKPDVVLKDARRVLDLDDNIAPTDQERTDIRRAKADAQSAQMMATMALEAAKIKPDQAQEVIA